jgi:DNA-binding GntR family transcriptional regulator
MVVPMTRVLQAGNALQSNALQSGTALVQNASVAATELIRDAIVEGRLEPGRRLKEEELARELGISRTPIREALLILQAEDLVTATPNRGAVVRVHDAAELDDLYELRALLEGHAARRAAERITAAHLEFLRESCERFADVEDSDLNGLVRENLVFHDAILELAGSARLASMVGRVIKLPLVYNSYRWFSPEQKRISVEYHFLIVDAFAAGDPDTAEQKMREHVFEARKVLVGQLRERLVAAGVEGA